MKIDAFVRLWPQNPIRARLAEAVLERLAVQDDARVFILEAGASTVLTPKGIAIHLELPADGFARKAREEADLLALSPIYVVIDDDHMPIGKDWIQKGVDALQRHPDYAMLSAWSVNGEVRDPGGNDEVFFANSCGTPCFVRKGTFASLPDAPAPEYDLVLSEYLKANHGRIGFLRHVRFNHLGYELSQVVPGHWLA